MWAKFMKIEILLKRTRNECASVVRARAKVRQNVDSELLDQNRAKVARARGDRSSDLLERSGKFWAVFPKSIR